MNTLKLLRSAVIAVNRHLKGVVKDMPPALLLRNCHPAERDFLAKRLVQEGVITREESMEFVKFTY